MGAKIRWGFLGLTWIDSLSFFHTFSSAKHFGFGASHFSSEQAMGAKLTAFENRANVEMEIRVFVPPDRPDRYRMIIRVKPGEVKKVLTKKLCNLEEYFSIETDNHIFLMVFMDGIDSGVTLLPWEVMKYAKIIGYYVGDCGVVLKGVKFTFTGFFRLNCHNFTTGRKLKGKYYASTKKCF